MAGLDGPNREFKKYIEEKRQTILKNADRYVAWLNSPSLKLDDRMALMSSATHGVHEKTLIESLRRYSPGITFDKLEVKLNKDGDLVVLWLNCSRVRPG